MRCLVPVLAILLLNSSLSAQEVIAKRGYSPELPGSAKWVGSKKPLRIEDLKGKIVIVHFWKGDSEPCEKNFKVFEEWLAKYLPANLAIIGIHGPDTENNPEFKDIEKMALAQAKIFPTVVDDTDLTIKAWKVEQVPTTFIVDKKGMLRYAFEGQMVYRQFRGDLLMEKKIDELLKQK